MTTTAFRVLATSDAERRFADYDRMVTSRPHLEVSGPAQYVWECGASGAAQSFDDRFTSPF